MMEAHPIAKIMPEMTGEQYQALKEDIERNGVRVPAWVYEGKLLDGRHRHRAATELGIPCPTCDYNGADPIGFVLSHNLTRRHLDTSQRALIAAKMATLQRGGDRRSENQSAEMHFDPPTTDHAAELLNVSARSVKNARKVLEKSSPEIVAAVEAGEIAVTAAAAVADLPQDQQAAALEKPSKPKGKAVEAMQAEIEQLKADLEAAHERGKEIAQQLEAEMAANAIFTADEPLKAAMDTIAERDKTIIAMQGRIDGLMNEKNAAIRQVKMLQRKVK